MKITIDEILIEFGVKYWKNIEDSISRIKTIGEARQTLWKLIEEEIDKFIVSKNMGIFNLKQTLKQTILGDGK